MATYDRTITGGGTVGHGLGHGIEEGLVAVVAVAATMAVVAELVVICITLGGLEPIMDVLLPVVEVDHLMLIQM